MSMPAIHDVGGALVWTSGLSVNGDGAAKCYHPTDDHLALDYLRNAGTPGDWYGVVTNTGKKDDEPIIQGPGDPAPGFCVSETALVDPTKQRTDPNRYVDAATIPFIVVPPELTRGPMHVHLGDLCWVVYSVDDTSWQCGAIVGDVGPSGKLGEGSIALADALAIPSSPKHGGVQSGVRFVLFQTSAALVRWPRDVSGLVGEAGTRYEDWGGDDRLAAIFETG